MWRIVYVSAAVSRDFDGDAADILNEARLENSLRGVTGLLTYCDGSIFQLLEGEKTDVEAIFARIERDPRHRSVIRLLSEAISVRDFVDWSMAWLRIPSDHKLAPHVSATLREAHADGARVSAEVRILLDAFSGEIGSERPA
ncbi:MAG: BLUF domain-containing protein [Pseudomonadota bacterium]